jgi:hypothetical protein
MRPAFLLYIDCPTINGGLTTKNYVLLLLADEKCRWFDMEEERGVLDRENKERVEGCLT